MTIPGGPLTAEMVDQIYPLQEPGGAAIVIKQKLSEGDIDGAEEIYTTLRSFDQGQVEEIADELCERHQLPPFDLDVLRAIRLGVEAGLQRGRLEGSNVVRTILDGEGVDNG